MDWNNYERADISARIAVSSAPPQHVLWSRYIRTSGKKVRVAIYAGQFIHIVLHERASAMKSKYSVVNIIYNVVIIFILGMQTMRWKPQNLPLHKTFSPMHSSANEKLSTERRTQNGNKIKLLNKIADKGRVGERWGGRRAVLCCVRVIVCTIGTSCTQIAAAPAFGIDSFV